MRLNSGFLAVPALAVAVCGCGEHVLPTDFGGDAVNWGGSDLSAALFEDVHIPKHDVASLIDIQSGGDDIGQFSQVTASSTTPTPTLAPLSGGTLAISADGHTAIAADSQRDLIFIAQLTQPQSAPVALTLQPGDEPGRVVLGPPGMAYVALRRGGAVVTVDLASAHLVERRAVCADPRGLAFDAAAQQLHVVCASGEWVTLPPTGLPEIQRQFVAPDLRDIVLTGGSLWISAFRSAQLWRVDTTGKPVALAQLPAWTSFKGHPMAAEVAWRTVALPNGGVLVAHQRARMDSIVLAGAFAPNGSGGAYGTPGADGTVSPIVTGALEQVLGNGEVQIAAAFADIGMPIDIALSPDGSAVAFVDPSANAVGYIDAAIPCASLPASFKTLNATSLWHPADPIAVAFAGPDRLVVQTRTPTLELYALGNAPNAQIALPAAPLDDLGHRVFHTMTPGGIACAQCHPEGREDGHVWQFSQEGPRRTQPIWGGVLATAPLHWNGDFSTLSDLMAEVFTQRMSGGALSSDQLNAMGQWLEHLPVPAALPNVDKVAAAAGKMLFEDPVVACASCHSGAHFTNNQTLDVGTGGAFQVPSLLGVSARLPLMHNGCAATLADRFAVKCGGEKHGQTAQLTPGQIVQLVAYLGTL